MTSVLPRAAAPARSEISACLALSWPLILTNAIEMSMNLTSVAMVGRIGPEALAAATLALALYSIFLLFGIGVSAAVAALTAREVGRNAAEGAAIRSIVQQGLWGVTVVAGVTWIVLWNSGPIFAALGQDPRLTAAALAYLHVVQWSLLPFLAYLVLRSLFAALQRPGWTVVIGAAAVALNAGLNWLLIFGHAGLPALGLSGSGLATLLSNIFMALALGLVAVMEPRFRRLHVFEGLWRPRLAGFGTFWRLGLPIGISLVLETGMFSGAAAIIGRFDAASLAAHAIALQVASLTFMIPLGIAQAAAIRVGRASGAGDHAAVVRAGWTALALGVSTMIVSATVLITQPRLIIGLFVDTGTPGLAAVQEVAVVLLGIAGLFQIADGAQVVASGMLRGLEDTRAPMIISAVGYWAVGLPVGAALAFWLHMRAAGVWIGMTAGLFSTALLLLARWQQHMSRAVPDTSR